MFDVPEESVLERHDEPRRGEGDPIATLSYNQSDRDVIRDGVDYVEIVALGDDRYRIDYTGYAVGSLVVTGEGLEAFGQRLLADREEIPRWLLSVETDDGTETEWLPERYDAPETVACAECGAEVGVDDVITLGGRNDADGYRCEQCWEEGYR